MYPATKNKCNYELENKEFILQKLKRKFRCISWHPPLYYDKVGRYKESGY